MEIATKKEVQGSKDLRFGVKTTLNVEFLSGDSMRIE
jgi:hypothetical protein